MEKVQVNKMVAGWIGKYKAFTKEEKLRLILNDVFEERTGSMNCHLKQQNIDIVTLAKAIQYGYEVPYEFKVGDIVFSHYTNGIYEITKSQKENRFPNASLEDVNARRGQYTLICKTENREDLK